MKINHKFYSNLAFNLADQNLGKTYKNPSVGCVIVKNNSVISSAVTSINGRPHAEYNALNKNLDFKDSNMYVTLEPCTHYGHTPPCTNIIKQKKIKNVFYSFDDPDERTNKKAKKVLRKIKKIKKISFKNKNFYKSYFLNKKKEFPLVDAKLAISKDFLTINKKSKWITNYRSRKIAHLLRSKYDCLISTSKTINKDNSLLNCRINGLNNFKPDLMIIDRNLRLKTKLKLFNLSNKRKIYIFTTSKNKKKLFFFKKKKINIIQFKNLESKEDFIKLFKKIFQLGYGRVLIESGLVFLKRLFELKLLNSLYLFRANVLLKKNGYNNIKADFIKKLKLNKKVKVNLKDENLFKIKVK
tara:strand:- start:1903 stop:2967 length:1065 start_codon:yes stop_codon:yes gene_type:complete